MSDPDSPISDDDLARTMAEEFRQRLEAGDDPRVSDVLGTRTDLSTKVESLITHRLHSVSESEAPESPEGMVLGDYRLLHEIGRGGMGAVYEAEQVSLGRRVAVKVMTNLRHASPAGLKRFQREASVASRLDHPGLCAVYDAGSEKGIVYIAMALIDGRPLDEVIKEESQAATATPETLVGADRMLGICEEVARALHFAHESGVIHRDVKPSNIVLRADGRPVVLDFGLARSFEGDDPTLTMSGDVLGTPAFMSPEQVIGKTLDRRTDVWSLGVVLYESVTGQRPFRGPTRADLFHAIRAMEPEDPRRWNAGLPRDLSVVIETALRKEPDRRYQTARDLADELRRVRRSEPIAARAMTRMQRVALWARRNPIVASLSVALGLALVIGLLVSLVLLGRARDSESLALRRLDEYDQMSDASFVKRLLEEESRLWPAREHRAAAMKTWLSQANEVRANLPRHREARDRLREAAAPLTPEQRERQERVRREVHAELFASIDRARGEIKKAERELAFAKRRAGEYGAEIENGHSERVADRFEELRDELIEVRIPRLEATLARLGKELAALEADPRLEERVLWIIPDDRARWRHDVLSELIRDLERLEEVMPSVRDRIATAGTIRRGTIEAHRKDWAACLADLRTNPSYGANPELEELGYADLLRSWKPPAGLVPLGRDDRSGLWEFWHVESGPRPPWRPTGPLTGRIDFSSVEPTDPFGLVLVLLPGGRAWIGAVNDETSRHHDPDALHDDGPVHQVTLAPFLLSKYEMTQGQWTRLMGANPSFWRPPVTQGFPITRRHPVEHVSWIRCEKALRRADLDFPTEAQWEYACRAGTSTPFWCGKGAESIGTELAGNISDREAGLSGSDRSTDFIDDGWALHCPVGLFAPNRFGLHDVLGNVFEWCRDRFGSYQEPTRDGDGARTGYASVTDRVYRGGGFNAPAPSCRSAVRSWSAADNLTSAIGLRPARSLRAVR